MWWRFQPGGGSGNETGDITHSGLWVDERSDSIHLDTQVFPVSEVNAVISKHVAADTHSKTSSYFEISTAGSSSALSGCYWDDITAVIKEMINKNTDGPTSQKFQRSNKLIWSFLKEVFVSSCVQCLTTRVGLQGSLHPADTTGIFKKNVLLLQHELQSLDKHICVECFSLSFENWNKHWNNVSVHYFLFTFSLLCSMFVCVSFHHLKARTVFTHISGRWGWTAPPGPPL